MHTHTRTASTDHTHFCTVVNYIGVLATVDFIMYVI